VFFLLIIFLGYIFVPIKFCTKIIEPSSFILLNSLTLFIIIKLVYLAEKCFIISLTYFNVPPSIMSVIKYTYCTFISGKILLLLFNISIELTSKSSLILFDSVIVLILLIFILLFFDKDIGSIKFFSYNVFAN
jgi:hypothetical protein